MDMFLQLSVSTASSCGDRARRHEYLKITSTVSIISVQSRLSGALNSCAVGSPLVAVLPRDRGACITADTAHKHQTLEYLWNEGLKVKRKKAQPTLSSETPLHSNAEAVWPKTVDRRILKDVALGVME